MFVDQYIADTIAPHVKEALNTPAPLKDERPAGIASDRALTADSGISPNRPHWLPDPITARTPRVFTLHVPIHFIFNKDKRLRISAYTSSRSSGRATRT